MVVKQLVSLKPVSALRDFVVIVVLLSSGNVFSDFVINPGGTSLSGH